MTVFLAVMAVVLGASALLFAYLRGYRARQFLLLLAFLYPVLVLNRWQAKSFVAAYRLFPLDWIVWFGVVAVLLVWWPCRRTLRVSGGRLVRIQAAMLALMAVLTITVVVHATGLTSLIQGVHALLFLYVPFFAAYFIVRASEIDTAQTDRILLAIYLSGLVTALLSVSSAVAPGAFSFLVASYVTTLETSRGFAPIGGPSAIGIHLIMVYAVAVGAMAARRMRKLSILVIVLTFVAVLTTLARAVLLSFILVNLYLFGRHIRGGLRRAGMLIVVGLLFLLPAGILVSQHYALDRFLKGFLPGHAKSGSLQARTSSQIAALKYGLGHPILGGGWGMVYPIARLPTSHIREVVKPGAFYLEGEKTVFKPHSLFALVFAEGGFPGLGLLVLLCVLMLRYLKPPPVRDHPEGHQIIHGFRAGVIGGMLMSLFQDHFALTVKIPFFFYLFALVGCSLAAAYRLEAQTLETYEADEIEEYEPHLATEY